MIRAATPSDVDIVTQATDHEPVKFIDADRYRAEYRPEWTWIAAQGDKLLARALWWGLPKHKKPVSLDCLWVDKSVGDKTKLAAELLTAGHEALDVRPDFNLDVPTSWRDDPRAVEWRREAAHRAGLTEDNERLNLLWTPDAGLPERSSRLTFEPADDDTFRRVFALVSEGSLDVGSQRSVAALGVEGAAADDLAFYIGLPGRRDRWRLAKHQGGRLVGFIVPSRSAYDASVSYLGVLPDQRGNRYIDDLLAEITHVHAADGADRITANTDRTNHPMAAAFTRGGYRVASVRLVFSAPSCPS